MGLSEGAARFAARHPVVWHVIEAEGAAAAQRIGLQPAASLHRLAGLPETTTNRPDFQTIALPDGPAVIRFQLMPDAKLTPTLTGRYAGRPDLWRQLIDSHVFFWTTERRRDSFRRAVARVRAASPGARSVAPSVILSLDTAALLARHESVAWYSLVNSGSTVRGGARVRRDETTFRPVRDYRAGPTAELAISGVVILDGVSISTSRNDCAT